MQKSTVHIVLCMVLVVGLGNFAIAGINDGLVAYYPFDGNVEDALNNWPSGEITGGVDFTNSLKGSAATFDGTGYINIPQDFPSFASFTISFWARYDSLDNMNLFAAYCGPDGDGGMGTQILYGKFVYHVGKLFNCSERSVKPTVRTQKFQIGHWNHFVVTFIGGQEISAYINGQHIETQTADIPNLYYSLPLFIGTNPRVPGTRNLIGAFDDLRIYNRALSANEIRIIYFDYSYTSTTLHGLVSENSSQGIPAGPLSGATVALSNSAGTMTTNSQGEFDFTDISPGTYTITVSKNGYYPESRQITLDGGNNHSEIFSLSPQTGAQLPVIINFESTKGSQIIEGIPDDMVFRTQVAWSGTPGSVQFQIGNQWYPASVITDLGNGMGRAEVTLPVPETINSCHELTVKVTNGEGEQVEIDAGVYFSPSQDLIPWLPGTITWRTATAKSVTYELFSDDASLDFNLSLPASDIGLKASFGYATDITYDLLGNTFSGSLAGTGGVEMTIPTGQPGLKVLGGAEIGVSGGLEISMGGCEPPRVVPSWAVQFNGKAGVKAPVVLVVDAIAPGLGSSLAVLPVVKDLKAQVFQKFDGGLVGEYEDNGTGNCFLGADGITGTIGGGPEATVLIEEDSFKAKAGVYIGGEGRFGIGICPDFKFENFIGKVYVGAFSEILGWKSELKQVAELQWDFTTPIGSAKVLSSAYIGDSKGIVTWQPIGKSLEKWGTPNTLVANSRKAKDVLRKAYTGSSEEVIVEDVTGLAHPSVFADAAGTTMLYAYHDTTKPEHAATDIGILNKIGTADWTLNRLTDDNTAEFYPEIAEMEDGRLMAAWARVIGDVSAATGPEDIVANLEILFSSYNRTTRVWSTSEQLTDNGTVDRVPQPVQFGTSDGVIWIANQGSAMIGGTAEGDRLMYRQWNGSTWSAPVTIFSASKGIFDFSFVRDSAGVGYVVFSVDEDGDSETTGDRELYKAVTSSGVWQPATRLTNDSLEDSLPVLVSPNGAPMLIWKLDTTLKYTTLASWSPIDVFSTVTLAGEAPTLSGTTMPGGAAIGYTTQSKDGIDIVSAFYDVALNQWSQPRPLTDDEAAESALSLTFDGTELVMGYLKTQTLRQDIQVELNGQQQTIENVPQPGRTDLYLLHHTLGNDLALTADALSFSPANPLPNSSVTLTATVENIGDQAVDSVPVSFYDGDPEKGGALLGETTTSTNLVAGTSGDVSISWFIPQGSLPHAIFVVVDPALTIEDRNRTNNIVTKLMSLPDLAVATMSSKQVSGDTVALTARVENSGVVPSGSFSVTWHLQTVDGPEIGRASIPGLLPGTTYDVISQWVVGNPVQPDQFATVYAVVDADMEVIEFNEENNTGLQSVHTPLYTTDVGSLTVTILPSEAVTAGMLWSVDNGQTWHNSGEALILLDGMYTIIFKPVPGYSLPAIHNVVINIGQSVSLAGNLALVGDIDGDQTVDLTDVILILQVVSGSGAGGIASWYDVDGDGALGLPEVINALQKAGQ